MINNKEQQTAKQKQEHTNNNKNKKLSLKKYTNILKTSKQTKQIVVFF